MSVRVLYVGSYKPTYPRNKIILDGLRLNGAVVTECNERSTGALRYVRLAVRLFRLRHTYDVMLVGFSGQEIMFVARMFATAPIVFDVFTSHYMGYVLDREYFSPHSFRAFVYRFLDRWSCRLADIVILDTNAHINFFVSEFGLPRQKFRRVFLGANTDLHHERPLLEHGERFSVLFWGSFIPLQGTEYIVEAARLLPDVNFVLAGTGQTRARDLLDAEGLRNVEFPGKVSDEELVHRIQEADVCLGAFSSGVKADITIQNKIFESLASRKPLITARTTAIKELLVDGTHCVLCNAADAADLARAITRLRDDPVLRAAIADNGYSFFNEYLTERHIGADVLRVVHEMI